VSCCLSMDGCETRPALTVSFRLERGGQFESGFQKHMVKQLRILQGQRDCLLGIPARKASKYYLEGYGKQYEKEQKQSAESEHNEAFQR